MPSGTSSDVRVSECEVAADGARSNCDILPLCMGVTPREGHMAIHIRRIISCRAKTMNTTSPALQIEGTFFAILGQLQP
jgi:hypothetical protein